MKWLRLIAAPSRLEILQVLFTAQAPLNLRTIEKLTNVSLRPIQLALPQLTKGGLISKKRQGQLVQYCIRDLPRPLFVFLNEIVNEQIRLKAERKRKEARSVGLFQEDAFKMLRKRKS